MKKLSINRYKQDPAHCAVASSATILNYYNSEIDYEVTKDIAYKHIAKETLLSQLGLASGEQSLLLNYMGFNKVTIVTCNLNIFDFTWSRLSRNKLINKINDIKGKVKYDYRENCRLFLKWLNKSQYDNNIKIDYNFGKYIRNFINRGKPVIGSLNWNLFFKAAKNDDNGVNNDVKGGWEEHAIVIYGYNKKNVFVCDSHHKHYKYRLKKYRKGFYTISWENFMTVMGYGDLILPEDYNKNAIEIT